MPLEAPVITATNGCGSGTARMLPLVFYFIQRDQPTESGQRSSDLHTDPEPMHRRVDKRMVNERRLPGRRRDQRAAADRDGSPVSEVVIEARREAARHR